MGIGILLGILKRFWPYILALIVIAGIYFHYKHLLHTIESQKQTIAEQQATIAKRDAEIVDLKQKLDDCQKANEKYQEAIQQVNAAADKLLEFSKQQQAALSSLKQLIGKERAQKAVIIKELTDLKQRPLAQSCQQAIDELIEAPKDFAPLTPGASPPPPTGAPTQ